MRLDEDLATLAKSLNELGCVSVEIVDDAQLKQRAKAEDESFQKSLTERERQLHVELYGDRLNVTQDGVESEVTAVCDPAILGACLALFGDYLSERMRREKEREARETASKDFAVPGWFYAYLSTAEWVDPRFVEAADDEELDDLLLDELGRTEPTRFEVTLSMRSVEGERTGRRSSRAPAPRGWGRVKAWWNG